MEKPLDAMYGSLKNVFLYSERVHIFTFHFFPKKSVIDWPFIKSFDGTENQK